MRGWRFQVEGGDECEDGREEGGREGGGLGRWVCEFVCMSVCSLKVMLEEVNAGSAGLNAGECMHVGT